MLKKDFEISSNKSAFFLSALVIACLLIVQLFIGTKQDTNQIASSLSASSAFLRCDEIGMTGNVILKIKGDEQQLRQNKFIAITNKLKNSSRNLNSNNGIRELLKTANQRKHLLFSALTDEPDAILPLLLPKSEREYINRVTSNCVEKQILVQGTLNVEIAHDYDTGNVRMLYSITRADGSLIYVHPLFKALSPGLRMGDRVRVRGLLLDDVLLFDGSIDSLDRANGELGGMEVIESSSEISLQTTSVQQERKTLIILAQFNNITPILGPSDFESAMDSARDYYLEASYDQVSLSGILNPMRGADVVGWYDIGIDQTCNYNLVRSLALQKAEEAGVDTSVYDQFGVAARYGQPGTGSSCGWSGVATVGGNIFSVMSTLQVSSLVGTSIHEVGHNLGNLHANFYDCYGVPLAVSGCNSIEYADPYDVMGLSGFHGHFNAPHKENVGWLQPSEILNVSENGTYVIEPMETNTQGLKALKLQRSVTDALYIEYRQPLGQDSTFQTSSEIFEGALLHIGKAQSELIDARLPTQNDAVRTLLVGDTFVDPKSGHSIEVLSKEPGVNGSLTVNVTVSGIEYNPPTVTLIAPQPDTQVSGSIEVQVQATDDSNIDRVEFYRNDYLGSFGLMQTVLIPDPGTDIYSMTLNTEDMHNGNWYVYAFVYDVHGNLTNTPTILIDVQNIDLIPPTVSVLSPQEGITTLSNSVDLHFDIVENIGVWKIELFLDGNTTFPYQSIMNEPFDMVSIAVISGPHQLLARVFDLGGNSADSQWVSFNVINDVDVSPPSVTITNPPLSGGEPPVVYGVMPITASVADNVAIQSVEFALFQPYPDPPLVLGTATEAPYEIVWDTTIQINGIYTLLATAYDTSGNSGQGFSIVEIDNLDIAFGLHTVAAQNAIDPAIDGTRVVWSDKRNPRSDSPGSGGIIVREPVYQYDIYFHDFSDPNSSDQRITNNDEAQINPRISDSIVAWLDKRGINTEAATSVNLRHNIYYYDLLTETEHIVTNGDFLIGGLDVSDGKIVWTASDPEIINYDIYYFDTAAPELGIQQLTQTQFNELGPDVDGNRVVWVSQDTQRRKEVINMYDFNNPGAGIEEVWSTKLSTYISLINPQLSGPLLAWGERWQGVGSRRFALSPYEIRVLDLSQPQPLPATLTDGNASRSYLDISGNLLTWLSDYEVILYDLAHAELGEQMLTNSPYTRLRSDARVSGPYVVWAEAPGSVYLYHYDGGQ